METGIRRDTSVYLEGSDWRKWISKTGRVFASVILALMFMAAPAHSAIDSVPAINAPPKIPAVVGWSAGDPSNSALYYSSPVEACIKLGSYVASGAGYLNSNLYQCNANTANSPRSGRNAYCPKPNYFMTHFTYVNWQNCSSYSTIQECAALTCTLSGSTKTCPDPTTYPTIPYELNTATGMCERNLPETYELKLTPDTATLEPEKTYDFTATVTKVGGGAPSKDVPISVNVEVDPTSGGHDHGDASRPKGKVSPATGNTVLQFKFTAPKASGRHTITATCEQCVDKTVSTKKNEVKVMVEGLEPIPDVTYIPPPGAAPKPGKPYPPFYTLVESDGAGGTKVIGATNEHKGEGNHYLTPVASTILLYMASSYHAEVKYWTKPKGKKPIPPLPLHLNDASLVWGGVFDLDADWIDTHVEHRRGTVIDVRANSTTGAIPSRNFKEFIKLAKHYGAHAEIHSGGTGNQHFHVRLLNRKE